MNNEMILYIIIYMFTFIIMHLIMHYIQTISSSGYFYGVHIKHINLEDEDKKRIDKEYKKKSNILFLITSALLIINILFMQKYIAILPTALILIYIFVSYVFLRKAYIEVKEIKLSQLNQKEENKEQPKRMLIDTKLLKGKEKLVRKFKRVYMINIVLSLISLIYLIINYNDMPDTIITNWGADGQPNGFSNKSIISVFYISFIDLSLVLMIGASAIYSIGARMNIDNADENRQKAIRYLNRLGYSFFILMLSMQITITPIPIYMVNELELPLSLTLGPMIILPIVGIYLTYQFMMLSSLKSKDKSITYKNEEDDNWLYGIFYYNKNDSSIMVEKRIGAGWTLNMANRKVQIVYVVFIIWFIVSMTLPFYIN